MEQNIKCGVIGDSFLIWILLFTINTSFFYKRKKKVLRKSDTHRVTSVQLVREHSVALRSTGSHPHTVYH